MEIPDEILAIILTHTDVLIPLRLVCSRFLKISDSIRIKRIKPRVICLDTADITITGSKLYKAITMFMNFKIGQVYAKFEGYKAETNNRDLQMALLAKGRRCYLNGDVNLPKDNSINVTFKKPFGSITTNDNCTKLEINQFIIGFNKKTTAVTVRILLNMYNGRGGHYEDLFGVIINVYTLLPTPYVTTNCNEIGELLKFLNIHYSLENDSRDFGITFYI
jgi:hypothetical protein